MILTSPLSDGGWPASAALGGTASAATSPAETGQDGTTNSFQNSFQNVLAQAVTSSDPAPPNSIFAAELTAPKTLLGALASLPPLTASGRAAGKAEKEGPRGRSAQAESAAQSNPDLAGAIIANGTAADPATASGLGLPPASELNKSQLQARSVEQNAASAAALGGAKSVSGAAFVLHVTPAGSPSNAHLRAAAPGSPAPNAAVPTEDPSDPSSPAVNAFSRGSAGTAPTHPAAPSINSASHALASTVTYPSAPSAELNHSPRPTQSIGAVAAAGEITEDRSSAAQPPRTIQVQLAGTDEQRVDLRLVEHAGGLSVSVRASDSALTSTLREHLPELSARLEAERYQTQTWLPQASEASNGGSSSGSSGHAPGHGFEQDRRSPSQGGSSSSNGDSNPQDRQRDQSQAWWRQLTVAGQSSVSTTTSVQSADDNPLADSASTHIPTFTTTRRDHPWHP